jgi:hypothetical protein
MYDRKVGKSYTLKIGSSLYYVGAEFLKKGKSREIGIAQNRGSKADKATNARLLRQSTINPFVLKAF